MADIAVGIWARSTGEYRCLALLSGVAGLSFLGDADARLAMDDANHCAPGTPLVSAGPYRFLSHPNYAVVAGEIAVLPLALSLPLLALVFVILNAMVLAIRIRAENRALATSHKTIVHGAP
jgi:protein-S-isoprenylcysteine O-methyltransferase Ste14